MFKHFLIPFDGSPLAEAVLTHTIVLARVFEAQVTLLCGLVYPHAETPIAAFDWQVRKVGAEAALDRIVARLQTSGVPTQVVKLAGQSARSVITYIHTHPVDLAILSRDDVPNERDGEFSRILQTILLRSRIPTLLVHPEQPNQTAQPSHPCRRLCVPFAETPRAVAELPFVSTLAQAYGPRLLLIHVLCQPRREPQAPCSQPTKTLAEQMLARKYAAVASHWDPRELPTAAVTESRQLESEEVAAGLYALAEAEAVDLVILSVHAWTASSQLPYGRLIPNFIAYGMTPLLVVQVGSMEGTPPRATGAGGETWRSQLITGKDLPVTWLYD